MAPQVVTGWSMISALGADTAECMDALRTEKPCLSEPPRGTGFETRCGVVKADLPALAGPLARYDSRNNRFIQSAIASMEDALASARDRWGERRIGICVGSSTAAMDEIESAFRRYSGHGELPVDFDVLEQGSAAGLLGALQTMTGLSGPATVVSNACASSGKAFASAKRWIEAGFCDAVLVGGADSLCQMTLRGFRSLGLLSSGTSRPFSAERDGINIGEGAAFALLEREGDGPLLLGTGESSDAHHMTTPDPGGRGASAAMQAALAEAGVAGDAIGYVNAHGTGTQFNDAMEARAIRSALGDEARPLVVSTKGATGHTLGAAGALEAVMVLEALSHSWIPASIGAQPVDPEIDLEIATRATHVELELALSNSFAFGGSNVSLVFGRSR